MNHPQAPAMEELLQHASWLQRLAAHLVGPAAADDLVQETWLAALHSGPDPARDPKSWLGRVLRNRAVSRFRAEGTRAEHEGAIGRDASLPSPAELVERADVSRRLVELVLELPEEPREVVLLRYFEGLSSADIARRLDRKATTVRGQLKRGLDELRVALDADNDGQRERWMAALAPIGAGAPAACASTAGALQFVLIGLVVMIGSAALAWSGVRWLQGTEAQPQVSAASIGGGLLDSEALDAPADPAPAVAVVAAEPDREPTVLAAGVPEAAVAGRLVNPDTEEPVVWFELAILEAEVAAGLVFDKLQPNAEPWPEGTERLRTDEEGRFTTATAFGSGELVLVPVEQWVTSEPRLPYFQVHEPSANQAFDHNAENPAEQRFELMTGPVFRVDCAEAIHLGAEQFSGIFSYLDHYPPGHFRPSVLQTEPEPFLRMLQPWNLDRRSTAKNLRLVSSDGSWSAAVPMTWPDTILPIDVRFELEPTAAVEVELAYGELSAPPFLELGVWYGNQDLTAPNAAVADIPEIQANLEGGPLVLASVNYVPLGVQTIAITAGGFDRWSRVVDLEQGVNRFQADLLPDPAASGTILGRVVSEGPDKPEHSVTVTVSGSLDGLPTFRSAGLKFQEQGGAWVAEFDFEHLALTDYTLWFSDAEEIGDRVAEFQVTPNFLNLEPGPDRVEFVMQPQLPMQELRVRARDAVTGAKLKNFVTQALLPSQGLLTETVESKFSRTDLELFGGLEGAGFYVRAEGYALLKAEVADAELKGSRLEVTVDLVPGWGAPCFVYLTQEGDEFGTPLEGVEVLGDGVLLATTDAEGSCALFAPVRPERLEFRLAGYAVASLSGPLDAEGVLGEYLPDDPSRCDFSARLEAE